ncbi:MAG TPA: protein phosphatase 2C domain-containing protein [Methylocella sp.]|nr:protein phosphatase 2C domain-containing protein [Methylocella sp.]
MSVASVNCCEFEIVGAMLTDVGRIRTSNEDAVAFVIPSKNDPAAGRGCLFLVADGMGGHAAGEVASALAVEVVRQVYFSLQGPPLESLRIAFESANRAIFQHSQSHSECRGMGTTCTALAVRDGRLWFCHVGDSRAYLMRDGHLTQLTDDQTLHAQMIREGLMTEEESKAAGGGNVILQALGTSLEIVPAVSEDGIALAEGDILVLCSDGLWNMVDDAAIAAIAGHAMPQEACQALVEAALAAGGYDNVSVGLFAVRALADRMADPQGVTRPIKIADFNAPDAAALRMIGMPETLS